MSHDPVVALGTVAALALVVAVGGSVVSVLTHRHRRARAANSTDTRAWLASLGHTS